MKNKKFPTWIIWVMVLVIVVSLVFLLGNREQVELKEFISVDFDGYVEKMNSKEDTIVYIGSATCSYCQKFAPIMKKIATKYNIDIYYFDTATITTADEGEKFEATNSYFTENKWGTPLVLIVNDNKVLDAHSGASSSAEFEKFLKNNGMIK